MAAYAALLSLMNTIHNIQNHPRPPICLHQKQILSLTKNLTFFQTFLERYSTGDQDELEIRITDAVYAAEDVIESHIVDQTEDGRQLKRSRYNRSISHVESIGSVDLYQGLERVIHDMDLIIKDVILNQGMKSAQDHHPTASARPASTWHNTTTVGLDDALKEVIDKLTGLPPNLQTIVLVGMGGIGKTTLARNIYEDSLIVGHFDILAWVTITREFSRREILQLLYQEIVGSSTSDLSRIGEDELGEKVYRELCSRRYLIVMDDIWTIEAWDRIKFFFPDNDYGSKIMMTTRLSNLALQLSSYSHVFQMKFLDEDQSWDLLCQIVFGKEGCRVEFEDIGKKIARNCRGLPLSIVVIGGLLANSNMTQEYWEYTLGNLNSCINLENEEYVLQILQTSYKELPVHLKPCFLYMGVFREDDEIFVSDLLRLWVAEGFLRPIDGRSLEEVAKECVKELVERNLILVHELRWNGKVRSCKIHDLLRDVCLREAKKQRFLCILKQEDVDIPQGLHMDQRRICIHENMEEKSWNSPEFFHPLQSASRTRSLLLTLRGSNVVPPSHCFRLLRIYSMVDRTVNDEKILTSAEAIFQQFNLRYFSVEADTQFRFPSSWSLLWNLQTLKVDNRFWSDPITAPREIWEMPLLRHVMFNEVELPDPPCADKDFVLEHLQTLAVIKDFKCSDEVVKRIPNIKTLKLEYSTDRLYEDGEGLPYFCLNNLGNLQKLESLRLYLSYPIPESSQGDLVKSLIFSRSLKKLTLRCTKLNWEDLTTTTTEIGSLPLLEVLKLEYDSCVGPEWETVEGQFCSLKLLAIGSCWDLKCWKTEATHFPRLEHLVLQHLQQLEEIPSCIGDISTLESIQLIACSKSAEDSAQIIKEEQQDYENLSLKVVFG